MGVVSTWKLFGPLSFEHPSQGTDAHSPENHRPKGPAPVVDMFEIQEGMTKAKMQN